MSGIGRFTGKDPVEYPGYEYVKNNPMNYFDNNGKRTIGLKVGWSTFYIGIGTGKTIIMVNWNLVLLYDPTEGFDINVESSKMNPTENEIKNCSLGASYDLFKIGLCDGPVNLHDYAWFERDEQGNPISRGPIDNFGLTIPGNPGLDIELSYSHKSNKAMLTSQITLGTGTGGIFKYPSECESIK